MKAPIQVLVGIMDELEAAQAKHPDWPTDWIHRAAIVAEEAGETLQAAIDYEYLGEAAEDLARIKKELEQTGAMVLRCLMYMEPSE